MTPRSKKSSLLSICVLSAFVLAGVPGCFSHRRYVDVDSKPTGATIFVDGEKKGVTRSTRLELNFSADPNRRVLIQLMKPRYRPIFQYWSPGEVPTEPKVFRMEVD